MAVHRRLRSSALFRSLSAEQRSVFFTLLLLANWKDQKALLGSAWVTIRRGELAHSLATIAAEAAVTVKVVRTTIAKLRKDDTSAGGRGPFLGERWTGMEPGTGLRVLSVLRYEEYQSPVDEAGTGTGTAGAREGHASGTAGAPREQDQQGEQGEHEKPSPSPAAPAPRRGRAGEKASDPRHHRLQQLLEATFLELRRTPYGHQGGRDGKAISELLRLSSGDTGEVDRRWRRALELGEKWPGCGTIALLPGKWNELAGQGAAAGGKPPDYTDPALYTPAVSLRGDP